MANLLTKRQQNLREQPSKRGAELDARGRKEARLELPGRSETPSRSDIAFYKYVAVRDRY